MELMEKGLAGMEISIGGESSTKTRSRNKSTRKPQPDSLKHTMIQKTEEQSRRDVHQPLIQKMEEQFRRDPRPPEIQRGKVEEAAAPTKTRSVKSIIETPLDRLRHLDELQDRINLMEAEYLSKNGIQRRNEEKLPREEQEIEDYRKQWERCYGRSFGSFDAETSLGHVYCATGTIPPDALPECSLQFFSIKVTDLSYSLSWPLQVHGFVAARDSVDHKRNYLFRCTRDSCQTLTKKDPFLRITGPSRAVLLIDKVLVEVQLKVKGDKESEDEVLAFKCFEFQQSCPLKDGIPTRIPGQRCKLECALAVLPKSIGATVGFRIVDGSWPDQCPGLIVCKTDNAKEEEVVLLLDFQDGKLPTKSDGVVELSRRLVSVGFPAGKLIFSVEASRNSFSAKATVDFGMETLGASTRMCDLVFCKLEVTVSWSLVSAKRD
ncbi:uncharacterized protein [Lolium perenne]|uniref:uncharacterized protein n=1 Tax=Lolium perenne TaxID=4522 RepID=UPI0021EA755E|nr:uncharacterized protein LOC127298492 [Lolium perenne]